MSLHGIQLAGQALRAHQRTIEITGQNIANATSVGYTRQRAVTVPVGRGPIGAGVDVAAAVRAHAGWLDRSADGLRAQSGEAQIAHDTASRVESLTAEPGDTGVQAALDRFFQAFQALGDRPDDATLRGGAVRASGALLERFAQVESGISQLRTESLAGARSDLERVDALARQAAQLTGRIAAAQSRGEADAALLDQRDLALEELTRLTGASVTGRDGGELVVSVGGATIVQGDRMTPLAPDTPGIGGSLGARRAAALTDLPEVSARLKSVRDTLVAEANARLSAGTTADGAAGAPLFTLGPDGSPQVNPAVRTDPTRMAVGGGSAGDGSAARSVADLARSPEIAEAYRKLAGDIAGRAADALQRHEVVDASLAQLQRMQAAESGVNLDEELAGLVAEQHVYAASARLLSTYDQMLETLIQRTG